MNNPAPDNKYDYPIDDLLQVSKALVPPDTRVICRRCPNAEWIEEYNDTEYGTDISLLAYCVGLGGQWVWPKRKIIGCSARRKAIAAERRSELPRRSWPWMRRILDGAGGAERSPVGTAAVRTEGPSNEASTG